MGKIKNFVCAAAALIVMSASPVSAQLSNNFTSLNPKSESILLQKTDVSYKNCLLALTNFSNFISSSNTNSKAFWIFAPNVDSCFHYRLDVPKDSNSNVDIGDTSRKARDIEISKKLGIPELSELAEFERRCMLFSNYTSRQKSADYSGTSHSLAIKHFPGGDVEITEKQMKIFDCTRDNWQIQLAPFKDIIRSKNPPSSIMVGHGSYPNLQEQINGDFILPKELPIPASISPYIVRGLLKQELGYGGAAISDWAKMGALDDFLLKYQNNLPANLRVCGRSAQKIILAADAGLNFLLGLNLPNYEISPEVLSDVLSYSQSNPSWAARFDSTINFNLEWCKNNIGLRAPLPVIQELSLDDKLCIFLGHNSSNHTLSDVLSHIHTSNFEDVWNRNGVLSLLLRYYYVCAQNNRTYCDPNEHANLAEWAMQLKNDSSFQKAYSEIDWSCERSCLQWEIAFGSLVSGETHQ